MREILQKVPAQQITVGPSKVTHRLDRSFIYGEVSSNFSFGIVFVPILVRSEPIS